MKAKDDFLTEVIYLNFSYFLDSTEQTPLSPNNLLYCRVYCEIKSKMKDHIDSDLILESEVKGNRWSIRPCHLYKGKKY